MQTSKASSTAKPTAPAAKKKPARSAAPADAVALLTADHKDVSKLFKAYEKLVKADASGDERLEVVQTICEMLTAHATIEEEIFYPALREAPDADDLLDEAEVEHATVKDLVSQLEAMDPDDDLYDAKVTVLGEYVAHHVQEEENEMFPKCRKAEMDLSDLAGQLAERKAELMAEEQETAA